MASTNYITSVSYASSFAKLPPGTGKAGVLVKADTSGVDPAKILVIRLRETTTNLTVGYSPTSGSAVNINNATYQPGFPLSTNEPYMVDALWADKEADPNTLPWETAQSAPVVASKVEITSAEYDGDNLKANISYGHSGVMVGAQVNFYILSSGAYVQIASGQTEGTSVTFTAKNPGTLPDVYFISAQAILPAYGGGGGSFAAPFSEGPPSELLGIPKRADQINTLDYDGENFSVKWTNGTISDCVDPDSSLVEVLDSGNMVAQFIAGPQNARFSMDVLGKSDIKVQVRTVTRNVASQPVLLPVITTPPSVTDIDYNVAGKKITVTVTPASGQGTEAKVSLYNSAGKIAGPSDTSSNTVSFDYDALGEVDLSIIATGLTSATGTKTIGPPCNPAIVLATTPEFLSVRVETDPSDSNNWLFTCLWEQLPDLPSAISGYTVNLKQGTSSVMKKKVTGTGYSFSVAKSSIPSGKSYTLNLLATSLWSGDSPELSLPIFFDPPQLSALATSSEPGQITASWAAPTGMTNPSNLPVTYQMAILSKTGEEIYIGSPTGATKGSIALADVVLSVADEPSLLVNTQVGPFELIADAGMGGSSNAKLVIEAPAIGATTYDPISGKTTLNWGEVTGAKYTVRIPGNPDVTGLTSNKYDLPALPSTGNAEEFQVLATRTSNSIDVQGPTSGLTSIPAEPGAIAYVRYNNTEVSIGWSAVQNALLYKVYVYQDSPKQLVTGFPKTTSDTSIITALTVTAAKTYSVIIVPVMSEGDSLPSPARSLFTPGFFPSNQLATDAVPYVYYSTAMANIGNNVNPPEQTITLYLPELGASAGALGTAEITVAPFTIKPSGNTDLPYELTIAASDTVWKFDKTGIRSTLQTAYTSFLEKIENPGGGAAGATAYGILMVQNALGRYLPQTYEELLYYNYGLLNTATAASASIDLRPGMVLRATIHDYINLTDVSSPGSYMYGYSGSTELDYDIGSYQLNDGSWRAGFDRFLSTLFAQDLLHIDPPPSATGNIQSGVLDASDLYYSNLTQAFAQPYYRLFIPSKLMNSAAKGSNKTTDNFTLAAASTYSELQAVSNDPGTSKTAYFRGMATLTVMIRVSYNNMEKLVPVGTTVGNLLEQSGLRPNGLSNVLKDLRVYRSVVSGMTSTDTTQALGPSLEIRFDWGGLASYSDGNGLDALTMPLLPGDQVFADQQIDHA